jgi:hypothetical protein
MRSAKQILDAVAKLKVGVVCKVVPAAVAYESDFENGTIIEILKEVNDDHMVTCRPVWPKRGYKPGEVRWQRLKPLPPLVALAYQAED